MKTKYFSNLFSRWNPLDLLSIFTIASLPLWMQLPENAGFKFQQQILIVLCFFISLRYVDRPISLAVNICIPSLLLAFGLAVLVYGSFEGYILILFLGLIKLIAIAVTLGFIGAKIYDLVVSKIRLPKNKQTIFTSLVFIFAIGYYWFAVTGDISDQKYLTQEIHKRSDLLKSIARLAKSQNILSVGNDTVIKSGIVEPIYSHNDSTITHGYGGDIKIHTNDAILFVDFLDIPAGEPCYQFYFINSPGIFGFKKIYVDGKLVEFASNTESINALRNKLCFSWQKNVNIRYEASFEQLHEAVF